MMDKNLWNQMYPKEEIERIEQMELLNDKRETVLEKSRNQISTRLEPIFNAIFSKNFATNKSKDLIDAQASSLSLRQSINESIAKHTYSLFKVKSENNFLEQEKYLFYSIGVSIKLTSDRAKKIMIDGNLRENVRQSEIIEAHIEFLRECLKTLESYQYSIKNAISLMEYLGGNN